MCVVALTFAGAEAVERDGEVLDAGERRHVDLLPLSLLLLPLGGGANSSPATVRVTETRGVSRCIGRCPPTVASSRACARVGAASAHVTTVRSRMIVACGRLRHPSFAWSSLGLRSPSEALKPALLGGNSHAVSRPAGGLLARRWGQDRLASYPPHADPLPLTVWRVRPRRRPRSEARAGAGPDGRRRGDGVVSGLWGTEFASAGESRWTAAEEKLRATLRGYGSDSGPANTARASPRAPGRIECARTSQSTASTRSRIDR